MPNGGFKTGLHHARSINFLSMIDISKIGNLWNNLLPLRIVKVGAIRNRGCTTSGASILRFTLNKRRWIRLFAWKFINDVFVWFHSYILLKETQSMKGRISTAMTILIHSLSMLITILITVNSVLLPEAISVTGKKLLERLRP